MQQEYAAQRGCSGNQTFLMSFWKCSLPVLSISYQVVWVCSYGALYLLTDGWYGN